MQALSGTAGTRWRAATPDMPYPILLATLYLILVGVPLVHTYLVLSTGD